ncbi:MAG: hypothetical protein ACFFBP_19890 [Promethearchaeota archaeon]
MDKIKDGDIEVEFLSTSGVYKTSFTLIIILQLLFGGLLVLIINLWFYNHLYILLVGKPFIGFDVPVAWWEWLLLPISIYLNLFLFSFSIILFSVVIFKFLNWRSPPREGVFEKGSKDWKYMHRRFWTAYLPIWLVRALPLPWLDIAVYNFLGVKIGRVVVAYEGYIDPLFIDIGPQTMTSLHICIFSHLIYHDKVIIKKIKVGKNCIIGPHTILFPGSTLEDGAILGANSYTSIGQKLEGNLIHIGRPASIKLPLQSLEESKKKVNKILITKSDDASKINQTQGDED